MFEYIRELPVQLTSIEASKFIPGCTRINLIPSGSSPREHLIPTFIDQMVYNVYFTEVLSSV